MEKKEIKKRGQDQRRGVENRGRGGQSKEEEKGSQEKRPGGEEERMGKRRNKGHQKQRWTEDRKKKIREDK